MSAVILRIRKTPTAEPVNENTKAKPLTNDPYSPKTMRAIMRAVAAVEAAESAEIERFKALHALKRELHPKSTFIHPTTGVEMSVMVRGDKIFWRTKPDPFGSTR